MSAKVLKAIRQIHLYLGVFVAPAVVFFAFTGILQTFSLHEPARDGSYQPARWIVVLAQIHKKQTPYLAARKPLPVAQTSGTPRRHKMQSTDSTSPLDPPAHNPLPLKLFFLVVGIGLITSTASGLYMSYRYCRNRTMVFTLLLAGIAIPIILLVV